MALNSEHPQKTWNGQDLCFPPFQKKREANVSAALVHSQGSKNRLPNAKYIEHYPGYGQYERAETSKTVVREGGQRVAE